MRVLVTGGSGFIGRSLVASLVEKGHQVEVLDRRHPSETGAEVPGVVATVGDIRDPAAVRTALGAGTDAVVHLAAITSVLKSKEDPIETFETNVVATQSLLERAREVGAGWFVMASTNAVAGDVGSASISESTVPVPLTPYGATKAAAEMLMSAYTASYGLRCSSVRLTNVYGSGMKEKDSFVPRLMRAALSGQGVAFYGDGTQRRDFVYVSDAVAGLLLPLDAEVTGLLTIGYGTSYSVIELHRQVCAVTGIDIPVTHEAPKAGEMPVVSVDIARAASFGYSPLVSLGEGLGRTWEDFRTQSPCR